MGSMWPSAPAITARILLVDGCERGNQGDSASLATILARHGANPCWVRDARLTRAALTEADLVLLDSSAVGSELIARCRAIRAMSDVPLIVLIEPSDDNGQVGALRAGADDCLVKPYDIDELIARIEAVLRRHGDDAPSPTATKVGDVIIDMRRMTVTVGDKLIDLTKKEFQVLSLIAAEQGGVCSRERLVTAVWGHPWEEMAESLHVLVCRLRHKVGASRIKTVRSVGYRLVTTGEMG